MLDIDTPITTQYQKLGLAGLVLIFSSLTAEVRDISNKLYCCCATLSFGESYPSLLATITITSDKTFRIDSSKYLSWKVLQFIVSPHTFILL